MQGRPHAETECFKKIGGKDEWGSICVMNGVNQAFLRSVQNVCHIPPTKIPPPPGEVEVKKIGI